MSEQHATHASHPLLLQACGLRRQTAGRVLLDDVSLTIHAGDRIAIVGPTASGKTLLLRALAMLDPIDSGEIVWLGKHLDTQPVPRFRSQVIYLHQRPALIEGTVEENLRQPFALWAHRQKRFDRARLIGLLETLGRDEEFLSTLARDLSGGEAQLTCLLRAMQLQPHLLLLDEPTAALDAAACSAVERLLQSWLDEQPAARAAVWVTHDHDQAQRIATSVRQVRQGRLSAFREGRNG